MKKVFIILMGLLAMLATSLSANAQEITITLNPGWNWISYPNAVAMEIGEALGDFVPMEGDMIKSQYSFSFYSNGSWTGGITHFMPGTGYKYYSARTEMTSFVFAQASSGVVATATPTDITATSAVVGGMVNLPEGSHVFLRGVCWGTAPNPDIDGDHSSEETGVGVFNSTLEGLSPGTTYYVRAYAVTDFGLDYGNEMSFTTLFPGSLNGLFSVGANTQVCFSQGNLQYQASTNTWRFAENQWDYVGEGNGNASPTYEGWIDLFSWGTSGYDHGATCYQPWTQGGQYDHAAYGNHDYDLCDGNGQADWGYNAISNSGNQERLWRTCKSSEWQYLLQNRQTPSDIRFAKAVVNGRNGLIILPDDWDPSVYVLNNTNEGNVSYEANTISAEDWNSLLENNGAVFLPATDMEGNTHGAYWTASATGTPWMKRRIDFSNNYLSLGGSYYPDERYSVRLVRSAPTNPTYSFEAVPNPSEGGTISGAGNYDYYASVVLTAIPNEGYTFYQWKENGKGVSMDNPSSFVSLFDRSLEACFLENSTYPLLYTYNDNKHTATVIGHWDGQDATGDLVIPETVMHNGEAYTVTAIGGDAFFGCTGLTTVALPNSLNSIGGYAFYDCSSLTSVEIPYGVTSIGSLAFNGTSIVSMVIPESVTSLGNQVFYGCGNLTSVTLPSGITSLGYGLFQYCGSLSSITIPAGVIWISQYAFLGCGLTSITILAEVPASIHEQAFESVNKSIPVYVPCGTLEAYQNANGWNEFTNINEMCPGVITVTANSAEYGTVSGGGSFEGGEICTVTATPNQGYFFESWTENGEVVSTDATYSFIVTGDRNLVANFSRHDYVDLGLPSGLLWATCNVGADNPEDYGDYFAWGETQPKDNFSWTNYQYCMGSFNTLTKYCNNPDIGYNGFTDDLTTLEPSDDAATTNWGDEWRMPTDEEWQELYQNTTVTWTTRNGVNGRLFTASNGNSLFLPAAGYRNESTPEATGIIGDYWTSSLDTDYPSGALSIFFNSSNYYISFCNRLYGRNVRAVRSESQNNTPTGAIGGKFTVNASGDQVYFSQGNLQYQASTNTWKFADNQYDYVGYTNSNISSTYSGWIDLFGWGTSGYNHGANCYQPWSTSTSYSDYYAYGSDTYNLYDQTGQADWGYNPISNGGNQTNQWRTLIQAEWDYVFNSRSTNSGIRYAKAKVNDVKGVILLPDDWSSDTYSLSNTNSSSASYGSNTITASQWSIMEQVGAVFLPNAGYRLGTMVYNNSGGYWSAALYGSSNACIVFFGSSLETNVITSRYEGRSVRLARVVE